MRMCVCNHIRLYVCLLWYMSIYIHVYIFYVYVNRYEWINLCLSAVVRTYVR